jgi:prepilin-type N-terminal cleavage/methylation domain-containing protein
MTNNKKGFTLIELLVVIAIIGILSAIGLVSLNGAREKARDAQRKSDLAQYKSALLLYYDDNTNKYPGNGAGTADDIALATAAGGLDATVTGTGKYLGAALKDPLNIVKTGTGAGVYQYHYVTDVNTAGPNANTYALVVDLEANNATKAYVVSLNSAQERVRVGTDMTSYHCLAATDICD